MQGTSTGIRVALQRGLQGAPAQPRATRPQINQSTSGTQLMSLKFHPESGKNHKNVTQPQLTSEMTGSLIAPAQAGALTHQPTDQPFESRLGWSKQPYVPSLQVLSPEQPAC